MFSKDPDLGIMEQAYTKLRNQSEQWLVGHPNNGANRGIRS